MSSVRNPLFVQLSSQSLRKTNIYVSADGERSACRSNHTSLFIRLDDSEWKIFARDFELFRRDLTFSYTIRQQGRDHETLSAGLVCLRLAVPETYHAVHRERQYAYDPFSTIWQSIVIIVFSDYVLLSLLTVRSFTRFARLVVVTIDTGCDASGPETRMIQTWDAARDFVRAESRSSRFLLSSFHSIRALSTSSLVKMDCYKSKLFELLIETFYF